ncbi:MAG: phytanoyl-CoA dioxygenase family protein [Pseudomonadota bacterium]
MTLTEAQRSAFQRDGVLVLEDVVPAPLRARIEAEYADVIGDLARAHGLMPRARFLDTLRAVHAAGIDWFQHLDITLPGDRIDQVTPFHYGPAVHDLLCCPALLDLAEAVLGPELTSNPIQHIRIKPPAGSVAADAPVHTQRTFWHQDRAVAHEEADATPMLTVWVAMTDATTRNGCLRVRPFAPGRRILPHCPFDQTSIPRDHLHGAVRELPVRAGGVVLLDPLVPHGAADNVTDGFRWSFDLRYHASGHPSGRAHFPDFAVRGAGIAPPDWKTQRDRWVAARLASANAPHVPIHRWTSDSPHCA